MFRNLITFLPNSLFTTSAVGYFEYLSKLVVKYCSILFSFIIGPPKSNWISSFGSIHFGNSSHLQCVINDFKFIPISVQACTRLLLPIYPGGYMATKCSVLETT